MTDRETSTEVTDEELESASAKVREGFERQKARGDKLQAQAETLAFKEAGVDADSKLGQAIKLTFAGDPEDYAALVAHAKATRSELIESLGGSVEEPVVEPEPEPTTEKPAVSAAEGTLSNLHKASDQSEPDALQEQTDKADEEGDVLGSIAGRLQQQIVDGTIHPTRVQPE